MTELYKAWREDPDIFEILNSIGLHDLNLDQQLPLEQAVRNPRDSYPPRKKLGEALGLKCIPLRIIRTLANAVEGQDWKTVGPGRDPQVALGSGHYKGLSHP